MEVYADIDPTHPDKITLAQVPFQLKELCKTVPGLLYDKKLNNGTWRMPLSWASCLTLRGVFKERLMVGTDLNVWAANERATRIDPCMALREALDAPGLDGLYPFQKAGAAFLKTAGRALCADEMGTGKGSTPDTRILTPKGWTTYGQVRVGDYVVGSNGRPTKVTGVYHRGLLETYRVTMNDQTYVDVDGDHLWSVSTTNSRFRKTQNQVLETKQMLERGLTYGSFGNSKYYIPMVDPIEFEAVEGLPLDPYTLGCVLGDGYISKSGHVVLASADPEIVDHIAKRLQGSTIQGHFRPGVCPSYSFNAENGHNAVTSAIRSLNLVNKRSWEKSVPAAYLYGSVDTRLAILRGLMDTDGYTGGTGAEFVSVSKALAEDVQFLVESLGGTARISNKTTQYQSSTGALQVGRPAYRLYLRMPADMNPFLLSRKAVRWTAPTKYQPSRAIRSIEPIGLHEIICISVEAEDSLYVTEHCIVTHNTRQAIAALLLHYQDGQNPFPCLIICPNSMKHTWKREIEAVWPGLEATVVQGSITQRRKLLKEPAHFKILNWEAVRSHSRLTPYGSIALKKCVECGGNNEKVKETTCQVHEKELNRMNFNAVIVDEAHRMVDGKSQQTRAIKAASGDAGIRIALTGTPIANSPDEFWSVLNWMSPEEWPSKTRFIDRYVNETFDMWGVRSYTGLKSENRDEFFATVNPRMRRIPKDLVLKDLPPLVHERRDIEMSPKQKKAYKQMEEKMMAQLDDGALLIETSPLTKALRLLQFASSYAETEMVWVTDEETGEQKQKVKVYLQHPSNKVDSFLEDLDDFGEKKIVVFAASRQLIELLSEKMTKKNLRHGLITGKIDIDERERYMDAFQNGNLQYMLCTTGAGGTGITLTAADTAVYLQRPWSMVESEQSEARVRRIGSEIHDSITIIDYVSSGTIDEVVIQAIETKSNRLQEILQDEDLLRRMLEEGPE